MDWTGGCERRINWADKDVNKNSRPPAERGVLLLSFWINQADSGFFWLNPKLSLGRGNHVTGNSVQFQPCLHEFNSLIVARSPYGRNQWYRKNTTTIFFNDFFLHRPHWAATFIKIRVQTFLGSQGAEMNYEFERESGFINSQPSLAECLTSFPPVADSFQSSSIKSSTLSRPTLIPPPFEQTIPSLNPGSHPRHGRPRHSPDGCSQLPTASLPPEYPWMREKKASKRNHLPTSTATAISNGPVCFSPKGGLISAALGA